MNKYSIHSDGGARGNPGPAAIGVVIEKEGDVVGTISRYIGNTTNNQAEYQALIAGLEEVRRLGGEEVECILDSELVVKQMQREYRVKHKDLAPLFMKVYNLSLQFKKISFRHVRREDNRAADILVNKALDSL